MFSNSFFIILLQFNAEIVDHRKHSLSFLCFGFTVAFLFANHLGDFTYDAPILKRSL